MLQSKGESVHHLQTKDVGRPVFNAIFARNKFQENSRMGFDYAGGMRQNRSSDRMQLIRKVFYFIEQYIARDFHPGCKLDF